jgi:insulysin
MNEYIYMAEQAKLDMKTEQSDCSDGIEFTWKGFNDTMGTFVEGAIQMVMDMMQQDLEFLFNQAKEMLLKDWKNYYLAKSYIQIRKIIKTILNNCEMEKKQLRTHLETFDYSKFKDYIKDWLKNGRFLWYINGNISEESALKIVDSATSKFGLKELAIEDTTDIRTMALDNKISYHIEIPLIDEKNDNSCNLTYYEVGPVKMDYKTKVLNQVVMQYMNEPYFDDLRTKQQLGYVVWSMEVLTNDVLACQFVV